MRVLAPVIVVDVCGADTQEPSKRAGCSNAFVHVGMSRGQGKYSSSCASIVKSPAERSALDRPLGVFSEQHLHAALARKQADFL